MTTYTYRWLDMMTTYQFMNEIFAKYPNAIINFDKDNQLVISTHMRITADGKHVESFEPCAVHDRATNIV